MSSTLQVVVVEESCLSRNVLVKALHQWGYPCLLTEDEDSAWSAVTNASAPCVLMVDWDADFLDCEDLVRRIRRKASLRKLHILAAVPRGALGAIRRSMECGASDVVSRPYDLDEVRVRLHVACQLMRLKGNELKFD